MKIMLTGDQGYIGSVLGPMLLEKGYDVIGYFPKSQTNLSKELTDIQGSYIIDKILTAKGTEDKSKSVKDALGRYSPEELQELLSSESMNYKKSRESYKNLFLKLGLLQIIVISPIISLNYLPGPNGFNFLDFSINLL